MNLLTLLEMVAAGFEDRVLIGSRSSALTGARLKELAHRGAGSLAAEPTSVVVFLGGNGPAFPMALFAASLAGLPFLPVNFRLSDDQVEEILGRHAAPLVISDEPARVHGVPTISTAEWVRRCTECDPIAVPADPAPDDVAVILMTSGTTAAPKSALLRHKHLTAYVTGSVDFAGSEDTDATIVSVPPYHIAAVANLLSNLYSGRRILYLDRFTAAEWLSVVAAEGVTHAMVVPTMLSRIVEELETTGGTGPATLRSISYGGAKIPVGVLRRALELFPGAGFVNAYGLTETASSIAVLGPADHRAALDSDDPAVQARLGSVGRPLPHVTIEVHDELGRPCPAGETGEIVVRGPQVAGEYAEAGSLLDAEGWFHTRDRGHLDAEGYLFVHGRADDTIIRGGENIAPAEIEAVINEHQDVADVAVAGIPDEEWGQRIAAFVVLKPGSGATEATIQDFVRARLRSSKTPDLVCLLPELPHTPTGKVLRRALVSGLAAPV